MGFKDIAVALIDVCLIFAPHIGYVIAYVEIDRTHNISGYAPLISLILSVSNALRIFFFIGKSFKIALLLQSIVAIGVHLTLLWKILTIHQAALHQQPSLDTVTAAVDVPPLQRSESPRDGCGGSAGAAVVDATAADRVAVSSTSYSSSPVVLRGDAAESQYAIVPGGSYAGETRGSLGAATIHYQELPPTPTWNSPPDAGLPPPEGCFCAIITKGLGILFAVEDYFEHALLSFSPEMFLMYFILGFLTTFALVMLYYSSIGRWWSAAPELISYMALGLEAMMVVPQILRNARRRSTAGLTIWLVLTWILGDVIKVAYYFYAKQPLAFPLCGCLQIGLDLVVVGQLVYYYGMTPAATTSTSSSTTTTPLPPAAVAATVGEVETPSAFFGPMPAPVCKGEE